MTIVYANCQMAFGITKGNPDRVQYGGGTAAYNQQNGPMYVMIQYCIIFTEIFT